jgi:ABC-2 type transport system ATP-binding protein
MAPVVEFQGITKEYNSRFGHQTVRALDDFTLSVESGEIFGFLGPNGAGKTTAMHIALGLLLPTGGSGTLLGRPFGDAQARRRVGFLPESIAFHSLETTSAIQFYARLNGVRGSVLRDRLGSLLERLDLLSVRSRPVNKLSRGMMQRVGLAQALINDPDVLFLDEPTSALDPASRVAVRELLLELRSRGKTIFLSSHLLSEIELISDRIGILHQGKLLRCGRLSQMLHAQEEFEIIVRNLSPDDVSGEPVGDGLVRFRVPAAAQRAAIERVWTGGGELVSINPVRRSLEELFLSLTSAQPPMDGASQ